MNRLTGIGGGIPLRAILPQGCTTPSESDVTETVDQLIERAQTKKLSDGEYVARIPDKPGLIAFGKTKELALIELWSVAEDMRVMQARRQQHD